MGKQLLYGALLHLLMVPAVLAQTGSLNGSVEDERTGEPLPGVNIYLPELERGGVTDPDGAFSLENIPYGTYQARVSFIGYRTLEEQVTIQSPESSVRFELSEDLIGMDELIVTGQGSGVSRYRLSTNVTSISAKQMNRLPMAQLDQILQANITNSQVRMTSGQPGTASLIRGRGVVSALASTTPVVYVDGVRVDNTTAFSLYESTGGAESSALADIPIENIERIEVVSGGAATTQFGSDAANGVIQIFTRQGVEGASRLSWESSVGAKTATRDFLRYDETGDILFSPGLVHEHRLSASGGSEAFNYSFSGSMSEDDGVMANNDQVRHSLRAAFGARLNDLVRYNGSFGFISSEFARDWNANYSGSAFDIETGSFGDPESWDEQEYQDMEEYINGYVDLTDISEEVKRFQTSQRLDFNIRENLTARAVVGLDMRNSGQYLYETNAYLIAYGFVPDGTTDQGRLSESTRNYLGMTLEAGARHEAEIGNLSFVTNAGAQLFRDDERQLYVNATEVPDGSLLLSSGSTTARNYRRTLVNYGVYLLENVGYRDRLFLEFGVRADQNSAFGEEVDTQVYPKVGMVYNLSSEPFFQDRISSSLISTLRLRANLGWAGNFPTPFSNQVLANIGTFRQQMAVEFGTAGDVNLRPERTRTIEVGGDLSFVEDRINLEVTWYKSVTEDALFNAPFAPSTGLGSAIQNLGTIENRGLELAGRFNVYRSREAVVDLRASVNTLHNEVVDNGQSAPFAVGGFQFLGSWIDEGYPVGYFRGNRPVFNEDGSIDEIIQNENLGDPLPDLFGNLGVSADYRNLSLTVTADYQLGAQGINMDEVFRFLSGVQDGRVPEEAIDQLGPDFNSFAGVWVEDADFLKVRLINLNYTLPERFHRGLVRSITVGASALNPFNFASSDFDPEVTGAGIARNQGGVGVGGFAQSTLSPSRQFTGRVRIQF